MRLFVCGVRGSTPAPGREFVRYGGNTSCVAVATDDDEEPRLVLDAGTGLQRLSRVLGGQAFRGTILLGHLHWDHTHGLPFFSAGDRPDSHVTVLVPAQESGALVLLERVMSPPHFPIGPSELRGSWEFDDLNDGSHDVEGFRVLALEIPHKGGRTFGYRITDSRGASMAYLSDHGPISLGPGPCGHGEYHAAARELVDGVDVLVHDAQYTAAEFEARRGFGHSTVDYAVGLATECQVGSLLLFHHDPPRTDDELDAVVAGFASAPVRVAAAREGAVHVIGRGS